MTNASRSNGCRGHGEGGGRGTRDGRSGEVDVVVNQNLRLGKMVLRMIPLLAL